MKPLIDLLKQLLNKPRTQVVSPAAARRLWVTLAFISGIGTGVFLADYNFSWQPSLKQSVATMLDENIQDEADGDAGDDSDSVVDVAADDVAGKAQDDSAVIAEDDSTEEAEEADLDDSGEAAITEDDIPDSLRAEVVPDQLEISVLGSVGLQFLSPLPIDPAYPVVFDRDAVLDDHAGRISNDFKIPKALRDRVGFWFDIYSTYDANHKIIHHSLYPWIVYKVIDVSYIINSEEPRHLWLRREKAERSVKKEALRIRATLSRLAHLRTFDHLSGSEQEMADLLKPLGGDLKKQARLALRSVRIQTGQKNFFLEGIHASSGYLGMMEDIFHRQNMPVELTRIPFVESSFNKRATSKVGALGIWQFMGITGRKYMMVNGTIDERRSPLKATEAAARLLKENHLILHRSWPLAVTAWNHGPTGMRRAIQRSGSQDLAQIIAHYRSRSFDFASANFYSEFLGALFAERYSSEIFGPIERAPHQDLQLVKLSRSVYFNDLVRASGLSRADLLAINPELSKASRSNLRLPRGFRLHVPEAVMQNLNSLLAVNPPARKKSS